MRHAPRHPHEKPHHPHRPLGALLFAFVLLLGLHSVHEEATWLHIETGARILESGSIPKTDPFSYTAAGRPWTTSSWLSDLLMKLGHAQWGPKGLVAAKSLACAAAFSLLLPLNPGSPVIGAGVLAVGAFAAWPGFTETPRVLDFLLLALLIRLLRPRGSFRWLLPLQVGGLVALWANLSGASAILGVWLAAVKVFKTSLRTTARERLSYLGVLAAAAAGYAMNPLGWGLLAEALAGGDASVLHWAGAQELAGPFGLFALAALAACWVSLQQEFFLTVAAASVLALSLLLPSYRPLAVLAASPVLSLALGHVLAPRAARAASVARLAAGLAALFGLHWLTIHEPLGPSRGYGAVSLEGALQFLSSAGVKGRAFNDIEAGSHLIGGGRQVFVDGRLGLYGESFAKDAAGWTGRLESLTGAYGFDYAVVMNRRGAYPARALDESRAWRLAYADDRALVYLRRGGANSWLIPREPAVLAPNRLWPDHLDSFLRQPRLLPAAMQELDRWLVQAPDCVQALLWKAYALERMRLSAKASRLADLAHRRRRLARDPELSAMLGFVREAAGADREALGLYSRSAAAARRRGDRGLEAAVLERLGSLHRRLGDPGRALEAERRRLELAG